MFKNYEKCRDAMYEYRCSNVKRDMEYDALPTAFYFSHNYKPKDIDKKVRQSFYKEIRQLVKIQPNLVYLLLAVMCAPYLSDMLMFHFYVPDEMCRSFVVYLTTALYGDVNTLRVDARDMDADEQRYHSNKAYCLNRYEYNGDSDVRLLEALVTNRKNSEDYRSFLIGNNSIIIATDNKDKQLCYNQAVREKMLIFSADLLSFGENILPLKRFITNCTLQYHHIINSWSDREILRKVHDCGCNIEYSTRIVPYLCENPHLRNQAHALYSAAALIKLLFHIDITSEEVDRIIINNFELYEKTKFVAGILGDHCFTLDGSMDFTLPAISIKKQPLISDKCWIHAEVYELLDYVREDFCYLNNDSKLRDFLTNSKDELNEYIKNKLKNEMLVKTENGNVVITEKKLYGIDIDCITLYFYDSDITLP